MPSLTKGKNLIAVGSAVLLTQGAPALALQQSVDETVTVEKVDSLTKQILLKEIELERFSLHYTIEVARQGRWKGWRYAAMQEANNSLGLYGGILSTWNRGRDLHHPERLNVKVQETANHLPMIGSIIGASAAAGEFGVNSYHDIRARMRGYSPGASIRHIRTIKEDIQNLLEQRQNLVNQASNDSNLDRYDEVFNAEAKVLNDMLEQSLKEFSRYHVGARGLLAFQQTQYLFDVAKYTTGAIGAHFAFLSLYKHKRVWNGRAGVLFAISGQLTMAAPILSRFVGWEVAKMTKRKVDKALPEAEEAKIAELQSDMQALDKLMKEKHAADTAVASITDREAIFDVHEKDFTGAIRREEMKVAAARLTATENVAAGAFVGGSKTAQSIFFLIPGYDHRYNSATKRAGRVTNDMLFTAAVVGLPATSFAILDTLRIQVQGEIQRQKARRRGALPGQIVAARLKALDDMERGLKASM
ncbi:MAG: hypothetical protein K2Y22_10540 [Candidatus Obscuribacterales bacterium]|nr:hypothetical protein [Candidatus Obscuribacterales bacterium]